MLRGVVIAGSAVGTIVGCSILVKDFTVTKYSGDETLEGKTVVITGANCGLGKEAATQFAKRKADVIMTCRDLEKCLKSRVEVVLKSGNKNVMCSQLDLASLQSINDFVTRLKKKKKEVNILVNNAGVMRCPRTVTSDGFEMQLGVIFF
ncbi:dehydrogenase-like protein [Leptotrombidium deliense]|uniref:Dehydrogenase-like protein n=1 Tax=Leptotrombidium deliense TaxID=299467 RepID=A0A443STX4_9ACAR|nr:dehydrogenase-like protein [Leptotrombidium deliense]